MYSRSKTKPVPPTGAQKPAPPSMACWNWKVPSRRNQAIAPLVTELAKRFEQLHPAARIDVQTGGSGKGIADARSGTADIGMASRALKADEADVLSHRIAADGVL